MMNIHLPEANPLDYRIHKDDVQGAVVEGHFPHSDGHDDVEVVDPNCFRDMDGASMGLRLRNGVAHPVVHQAQDRD